MLFITVNITVSFYEYSMFCSLTILCQYGFNKNWGIGSAVSIQLSLCVCELWSFVIDVCIIHSMLCESHILPHSAVEPNKFNLVKRIRPNVLHITLVLGEVALLHCVKIISICVQRIQRIIRTLCQPLSCFSCC